MAENNFDGLINSLMEGMDGFLSTKTVVGDPTKVGDTIIVPLVDVSFGVGAGAARGDKKNGGMGALSGKMTPSAVLVISNGHTIRKTKNNIWIISSQYFAILILLKNLRN